MKAYLVSTGSLFALITLVHVWRVIEEPHLATHAWYIPLTLLAGAMSVWAWRLLRLQARA